MTPNSPPTAGSESSPASHDWRVFFLALLACTASLTLYAAFLWEPFILQDDFQILRGSWTWQKTWADLWVPQNEHAMPAGRLTTWVLIYLSGRLTTLPWLCSWQGPLALVAGMGLAYLFVRREMGHPLPGLAAMSFLGVSTVYHQAVIWFASSFSILAMDFLLLALLAAQALAAHRTLVLPGTVRPVGGPGADVVRQRHPARTSVCSLPPCAGEKGHQDPGFPGRQRGTGDRG